MELIIANPPKTRRRKRRIAKRSSSEQFTKRKRRRSARRKSRRASPVISRRSPTVAKKRKSYRRRARTSPARGRKIMGSITTDLIAQAGLATAAMVATNMLLPRLPVAALKTGTGAIAGKVAIGAIGSMVLGKFAGGKYASAFALGALISVGIDVAKMVAPKSAGVAGLGEYDPLNVIGYNGLGYVLPPAPERIGFTPFDGLGCACERAEELSPMAQEPAFSGF